MKTSPANWRKAGKLTAIAVFSIAAASSAHAKESIFSPGDKAFSVSFPGKPTCSQQDLKTPGGAFVVHTCTYSNVPAQLVYSVTFFKIPPTSAPLDSRRVLKGAMEGEAAVAKSQILEVKDVSVGTYPGLQSVMHDSDGLITRSQYVHAEGRLLSLAVAGWKGRVPSEVVRNFFGSLKVNRSAPQGRP